MQGNTTTKTNRKMLVCSVVMGKEYIIDRDLTKSDEFV